jgi:tRNA(Arg) A34 adenosine deaminase TadA
MNAADIHAWFASLDRFADTPFMEDGCELPMSVDGSLKHYAQNYATVEEAREGAAQAWFMKANPYMELALAEAELAAAAGETPVGAVVVSPDGGIAGRGHNLVIATSDPTAHAEILAIRQACRAASSERLPGYDLYVTLEPCAMCAAAISFARIRRIYFGTADEKGGAVEHGVRFYTSPACHHAPEVYGGIAEARASALLKEFFRKLRA